MTTNKLHTCCVPVQEKKIAAPNFRYKKKNLISTTHILIRAPFYSLNIPNTNPWISTETILNTCILLKSLHAHFLLGRVILHTRAHLQWSKLRYQHFLELHQNQEDIVHTFKQVFPSPKQYINLNLILLDSSHTSKVLKIWVGLLANFRNKVHTAKLLAFWLNLSDLNFNQNTLGFWGFGEIGRASCRERCV